MAIEHFNYIIVGGGLCGCVIASRLSQAGESVLLLEFGPDEVNNPAVKTPLLAGTLPAAGLVTDYATVPQKWCNGRSIINYAGRMLGGGSSANVLHWSRPSSTDFAHWVEVSGNDRWSFDNLLPYMNRAEHWHDPKANPAYHGFAGPVHTTSGREYPMRSMVKEALLSEGYKENLEAWGGNPLGFNSWTENMRVLPDGSAERQHAPYVYDLSKASVMPNSPVRRVIVKQEGPRKVCRGVELVDGSQYLATKEVILCAGAHKTPQILMLSGIGATSQLNAIGVAQILDAPDVGRNLYDHLGLFQHFKLRHPEKGLAVGSPLFNKPEFLHGLPLDYVARFNLGQRMLKHNLKKDEGHVRYDDPLLLPMRCHGSHMLVYIPAADPSLPRDGTLIGSLSFLLLPRSRGHITLNSDDPLEHPVTDPNYFSTHVDRWVLRQTVRKLLRLVESPRLAAEIECEVPLTGQKPLTSRSSDEEIDVRIRNECVSLFHPMGTAAMGKVVDGDLKVLGVDSLRVVDASIFPSPISTMPQATLYGIAEMMSDVILDQSFRPHLIAARH